MVTNVKGKTKSLKARVKKAEEEPLFYLHRFQISNEITENGEYYAKVSSIKESKDEPQKSLVKFEPFDESSGHRVYFEPVYVTLDTTNVPSSPAGQFLTLFQKARHWGDIQDRVVGLEIKRNEGKEGRIFKNVTKVFETDIDELVFDDDHMSESLSDGKTIDAVINSSDDELEEEVEVASPRTMALLEEDDDDLELEDEE